MFANCFLNTNIQKIFMRKYLSAQNSSTSCWPPFKNLIKGTNSLTVCWLGSTQFLIIVFTPEHHHAPYHFKTVVATHYSILSEVVTSQSWMTTLILLQIGVYPGKQIQLSDGRPLLLTTMTRSSTKFSTSSGFTNILHQNARKCCKRYSSTQR